MCFLDCQELGKHESIMEGKEPEKLPQKGKKNARKGSTLDRMGPLSSYPPLFSPLSPLSPSPPSLHPSLHPLRPTLYGPSGFKRIREGPNRITKGRD